MVRITRRAALRAIGGGVAVGSSSAAAAAQTNAETSAETVVEISGERVPENLAIADDGTLYFGITAGEVWRLSPEQTQETGLTLDDLERVATLPGSAAGVEVVPDGTLYVASQSESGSGVWEIPADGGDPTPFASVSNPGDTFVNDVLYDDERDRLLVTESFGGEIYELPLGDASGGGVSVWSESDLLDTESFGANGLTIGPDGSVYVAVTRTTSDGEDVGRIVGVPVAEDGSAGDAATYVEGPELYGADGITTRGANLYVAVNAQNEVVRVAPGGETTTVASGDDGLVFPSDVAFGTTPQQRGDLFVCNFANDDPEEGAILRATVSDAAGAGSE